MTDKIHEISKKNFESEIYEYAGPRMLNREWVRLCCTYTETFSNDIDIFLANICYIANIIVNTTFMCIFKTIKLIKTQI